VDWIDLGHNRDQGRCEHNNETSDSIGGGAFLD
jgi:hypothetical protein